MRNNRNVARAEIGEQILWILKVWEPEERSRRNAERQLDRTEAFLNFLDGLIALQLREVGMRPSMATNGMALGGDLLEYLRMPESVFANREECRFGAMLGKGS